MNMSENFISSLHIQKLGHKLEEIRIRALNHVLSKLDHGNITKNDMSRCLELLQKLFEWFDFEKLSEEEKVLNLIFRILKSEIGVSIVKHVGTVALVRDLRQIRANVKERQYFLVDRIIQTVESVCDNPISVPLLVSDLPLSYRSGQTVYDQVSQHSRPYTADKFPSDHISQSRIPSTSYTFPNNRTLRDSHTFRTNVTDNLSDRIGTAATTISGLEYKSTTGSGLETGVPRERSSTRSSVSPIRNMLYKSVPHVTMNWQPLVKSDCHVLKSVEESLQNPPQPSVLMHSCEFFCNVMLQDFPAEVFLQRPSILSLFYEMINTCPSTRITNASLICLNKLSENLITRIKYYSDPCTYNLKQGTSLMNDPENCNESPHRMFDYNIDISKQIVTESDSEDNELFQCSQISVPQYCIKTFMCILNYISEKPQSFRDGQNKKKTQSGINTALQVVDKLVSLTTMCIKSSIWENHRDGSLNEIIRQLNCLLEKLGDVLEQFRLMVVASDMEYFERMAQLHLLHSTSYLLTELVPISKADTILPRTLKNSLSSSLLDASFGRLYPAAHESLVQYVNVFSGHYETESLTKYKDVQQVCKAMTKAVKILKHSTTSHVENLQLIFDSLPSLEFHKNLSILNTFLKICVKNNSLFSSDEVTQKLVGDILLAFLSHSDEDIQIETYSLCQKLIVNILGINHTKHISETDPGSQVVFFFRSDVFIELAAHGLTSNSVQIQTYAEDILIHILKCKFLVSESVWRKMIRNIIPAMPILQCYMNGSTPLGKAIVKIMDPDISPSLFMSTIDVLKGNLRMLFSKDIKLRNEAVSRLCWLLTTEEDANEKLPKIKSLQDCGLSNIFQFEYPLDLSRMKSSSQFYQVSSLQQVLELLSSKSVEPAIRRSALTQVSVMLEDHFLHPTFLEQNGLKLVLNILQNSLNVHQYHNYPDSVIPAITILKNICLHNAVIRQELTLNIDLIFNLLRALFLYCTDKRMQQDGALLCCLLLFSEFAIYSYTGKDIVGFSLPEVIIQKLHMPFKCHTHWKTSRHSKPSLVGLLMTDNWCRSTLRMHWNIEWFGGISELITWSQVPAIAALSPQQLAEFSTDLRLTKEDLLALKASSVVHCCQKYLFDIENATTHLSVLESVRGIAGYVGLWLLAYKSKMYTPDETLMNLPWNSAFCRFLSAPPANNEDQNLLIEILRCLTIMLKLYKNSGNPCWITNILQDSAQYLPKLLQVDVKSEHQSVSLELLTLVAECSTLEQHLLDIGIVSGTCQQADSKSKSRNKNWIHIVQTITENLKFSDTEQFYNLAYLNKLLACLVQITSNLGWSEANAHATDFHKLFSELVGALSELLTSFHYGKGAEAASSFMGMSITRNALLTMNHILSEMQHTFKKNWDTYWVSDTICSASLFSLYSLWSCRDVVVRAATLQLLSGLATSPRGSTVIVETVRQKYGGVWEAALMILMDHSEASIVREHAALLLTNLCSHANVSGSQVTLPLCHSPLSANKDMSQMETVLLLLKEYNFFEELDVLLSCLHLDSTFQPNLMSNSKKKTTPIASVITTARSYVATSSESTSSHTTEGGVNVFVTPSLAKAVASFVSNLLFLAPEQVSALMEEHALVRSFFRCLSSPSFDVTDSRHLLLYADILEMCSSVCALLTRTVLVSVSCRMMALHTRDCLYVLISLLNPSLYDINLPHFLYLRNQLWCEIFRFFTALLDAQLDKGSKDSLEIAKGSYKILSPLLAECGYEPFIKSIYDSIESQTTGLQKSALQALTSLLTMEALSFISKTDKINSFSLQHLLDEIKTPRDVYTEDIENIDPNVDQVMSCKRSSLESAQDKTTRSILDSYRNTMMTQEKHQKTVTAKKLKRLPVYRSEKNSLLSRSDVNLMVGADLCKILLRLYEMSNLENNKDNKRRGVIIGALSSLLNTSDEAKKCALEEGLLTAVITHLKNLHVEVSLHSAESLRKISDKKKVCPILKEVDSLFGLLTNFVKGNEKAKETAAELGLADITHKYWLWFCLERSMLVNALKMLCTFTSKCDQACQSLTLTNPAPGSGPRKVATSVSLLNVIINLISKEMELVSRSHDITVLQLSFQVLQSVCSVLECRTILAKSNLFQSLNRLHPALTKRQRPWETIEQLWLEFLETFTFHPEGQLHVTKTNDVLELILTLTSGPKANNKLLALSVLRNVSFHQSNRIKLLASVEFIQLLHTKLTNGTFEEKNIVVSIIWALVANSQRSKMVIKCAGLDARIQDLIKQYEMKGINDKSYQTMLYVFAVLKDGDK